MTIAPQQAQSPPRWTFDGFRLGAVATLPLLPGVFAFGVAFGTVAARNGLTLVETLLMSATVNAGTAQIVVLESWPGQLTFAAIAGMALITAVVCMRFLMIGASLRPWLGGSAAPKVYPSLFVLTEPNWILSMRYRAQGGSDAAYFTGAGVVIWCVWVLSAAPGHWLGTSVDPHRFGLDLIVPAFFSAMLVSLWRGAGGAISWAVGAAVAVAVDQTIGGSWSVLAGAFAGMASAGVIDADK